MRPNDPITACPACGAPIVAVVEADLWRLVCPCGNEWERETAPTVADLLDQGCERLPAFRATLFAALGRKMPDAISALANVNTPEHPVYQSDPTCPGLLWPFAHKVHDLAWTGPFGVLIGGELWHFPTHEAALFWAGGVMLAANMADDWMEPK